MAFSSEVSLDCQVTVQMYECMEAGIEDNIIQWGKRILIEDLSEDDANSKE